MRYVPLVLLALALASAAPAAQPDATLAFARPGGIYLLGDGRARLLAPGAADPSWSPDGRRLAYVAQGAGNAADVYVIDANGSHRGRLTWSDGVDEAAPSWSPDGRRLVVDRGGEIVAWRADGSGERVLAGGMEPAWSPDGRRIAFSDGDDLYLVSTRGGRPRQLVSELGSQAGPAWSPDGRRLVYVSEESATPDVYVLELATRRTTRLTADDAAEASPAFTANGRSVIYAGDRTRSPQTEPQNILHARLADRQARRPPAANRGGCRGVRYVYSAGHTHLHVMGFQRYELRRASDNAVILRDRKSGFCLADHWAHAPGHLPDEPSAPVFKDHCEQGRPDALAVHQGTSVGYTDRYPSHFHGQNLDVTRIAAGTYVLVHRANRSLLLRELRYENNAAAVRIRLAWPRRRSRPPSVRVLRTCPDSERC